MKSLKSIFRGSPALIAAFLPLDWQDHDKVSKETKTAHDFFKFKDDKETGKDRLYIMFSIEYVNNLLWLLFIFLKKIIF